MDRLLQRRETARTEPNPLITLKRYSHLLDTRLTEVALRYDPTAARAV